MARWTAAGIPDQAGRTIVVTGANSGLGAATATELARAGAHVVLGCRETGKGERAAAGMPGSTEVRRLDLADLASVREFAAGVGEIAVLVNNAGVMATPLRRTRDGFELQIGTNHLGHFALTGLLLDRISDRVVTVSSGGHRLGRIDLDDLNWEQRRYQRWLAYGQAKLANLLFTPGGSYIGPDGLLEQRGYPTLVDSNKRSDDQTTAAGLWTLSQTLTAVTFTLR